MTWWLLVILIPTSRQHPATGTLPGAYPTDMCNEAPFPVQLPPLDSVVDTATLKASLRAAGVNRRVVVTLRLGTLASRPRVRLLEKRVSDDMAVRAVGAIEAALRPAPDSAVWGFRLRVERNGDFILGLERSKVCAAIPGARQPGVSRIALLMPVGLERRLRMTVHRVLVDSAGRVIAVTLVTTGGDLVLDDLLTEELRQRHFTPTTLDGVPVAAWVEVRGDQVLPLR